jgi:hypothetical protein
VTAEPFDLVLTVGGTSLKLRAEPVEELESQTVYVLTAESESGACERCGSEDACLYLIDGLLRTRCHAHAEGVSMEFDPIRIPKPSENTKHALVGSPRWFHLRATHLRDQGLSLGDISKSLEELGHPLGKRQIQRHLAGDCGCER